MPLVRLVHWSVEEASTRVALMESEGYDVLYDELATNDARKVLLTNVPDVYVIDLSLLPKLGSEVGKFLGKQKASRHVPLIFAAGSRDEVKETRRLLPNATYSPWDNVTEDMVRKVGLAAGMVDYKVTAIDSTWSGPSIRSHPGTAASPAARLLEGAEPPLVGVFGGSLIPFVPARLSGTWTVLRLGTGIVPRRRP